MQRKPSHFGSYAQPSPSGSPARGAASIGSSGGSNGRRIAGLCGGQAGRAARLRWPNQAPRSPWAGEAPGRRRGGTLRLARRPGTPATRSTRPPPPPRPRAPAPPRGAARRPACRTSGPRPRREVSMAHAQAEQETARRAVRERRAGGGDLCRRVRPDAQDARGDDDLAGGREALVRDREELRPGPTRHPDRAVAERLELGDGLTRLLAISTAKLAIPDADPAESDLHASLQSAAQILPVTRGMQLDERASGHDRAMVLDVARVRSRSVRCPRLILRHSIGRPRQTGCLAGDP